VTRLSSRDVAFHPHSFGDPDGRLFRWDGGLFRALRGDRADFFRSLLDGGVIDELASAGLFVPTEATALEFEGYDLVVRHRSIDHVSYPTEWCAPMFGDAASLYLDLLEALARRDLTLKDVHPWNLVFDGPAPLFVDLTSIAPAHERSPAAVADRFRSYYVLPLLLMAAGHAPLARSLMLEYDGVTNRHLALLVGRAGHARRRTSARRRKASTWSSVVEDLRREIAEAAPPTRKPGEPALPSPMEGVVHEVIADLDPPSILTFEAQVGLPERIAGPSRVVVAISEDEGIVADVYRSARADRLPILPVLMDFTKPTPSIGFSGGHFSIAATERLPCALTIALDLVPRVVSRRSLTFEQVSEGLSLFTRQSALVGFAPLPNGSTRPPWYREDALADALAERFRRVRRVTSQSSRGSDGETTLFVCEK
jgi:hypothetical protein